MRRIFKTLYELFTKRLILGLKQIKSICRLQNKCDPKSEFCYRKGRKCLVPGEIPFPTMFSTGSDTNPVILAIITLLSANAVNSDSAKILRCLVKSLILLS